MTRSAFRTLVKGYAEFVGSPLYTTDADVDDLINRGCAHFSVLTACLYTPVAVLTTTASGQIYNLNSTAVCSPRIWLPLNVVIGNTVLKTLDNKIGPCTHEELAAIGSYGQSNGTPTRWCRVAPHSIRFDKPASGALSNSYVEGYRKSADITTGGGNDSTEIDLPEEYHWVAAAFVASMNLDMRASGGQLERVKAIDAKAATYMEALMAQGQMVMMSVLGFNPMKTDQSEVK